MLEEWDCQDGGNGADQETGQLRTVLQRCVAAPESPRAIGARNTMDKQIRNGMGAECGLLVM